MLLERGIGVKAAVDLARKKFTSGPVGEQDDLGSMEKGMYFSHAMKQTLEMTTLNAPFIATVQAQFLPLVGAGRPQLSPLTRTANEI